MNRTDVNKTIPAAGARAYWDAREAEGWDGYDAAQVIVSEAAADEVGRLCLALQMRHGLSLADLMADAVAMALELVGAEGPLGECSDDDVITALGVLAAGRARRQ